MRSGWLVLSLQEKSTEVELIHISTSQISFIASYLVHATNTERMKIGIGSDLVVWICELRII